MFTIVAIVLFTLGIVIGIGGVYLAIDHDHGRINPVRLIAGLVISAVIITGGIWFQTHRIVPTQEVGVTVHRFTQELRGPFDSGLVTKPFFGSVKTYPASSQFPFHVKYTPAITGSIGVTVDLVYFIDASSVDWRREINRTGTLDSDKIMKAWRDEVVGEVANAVKTFSPQTLGAERSVAEAQIRAAVEPFFVERGVPLVSLSFLNWDFTNEAVGAAYDRSIEAQTLVAEEEAKLRGAQVARERELFEAETALQVASKQRETLDKLGLGSGDEIQYLWLQAMIELNSLPDSIILSTTADVPVVVPAGK